ncbi:hypothetical protein BDV39DRAFT_200907 [Aspergillus sergii]|uniref:Uncharacterized protein n=1 Tax=Aspergillus sergii TaxID=1034303 RepID=A0A5N6XET9_9EURO|nr:hypothetical protein BDV39DRAFT_200907 [Aspergillus sergii]
MLGFAHMLIVELFKLRIHDKLVALDVEEDVYPSGSFSSRYGDWGVVLEVGTSETAGRLEGDARGWLESSGSSVKACITINLEDNRLIFDVWQPGWRVYQLSSRNSLCPAGMTQRVESVNEGGLQVSGWRLEGSSTVATAVGCRYWYQ